MSTRILTLVLLISMLSMIEALLLLYNTENSVVLGELDCIYYTQKFTIKYCLRPSTMTASQTLNYCLTGEKWLFTELLRLQVSPWEVLSWSSSVEKADDYAQVFYNRLNNFDKEAFLCNCTLEGSFGKYCEYQLPFDTSFSNALDILFERKTSMEGYQLCGKILCYETLICEYGMLCLDWRNICDGVQNCMDGVDEENCDKLEFNECEHNEYRCLNGMCIPEEYWLDGQQDCMDWSDEAINGLAQFCPHQPMVVDCDDHTCLNNLWSCGDGQCINAFVRHVYQDIFPQDTGCFSMREYSHICETGANKKIWTKSNGLCAQYGYNDSSLTLFSQSDTCIYLIRCALSMGAELKCPCNGTNCVEQMRNVCKAGYVYPYPPRGIIRPWIFHFYQWNRTWEKRSPDVMVIVGRFQCREFLADIPFEGYVQFIYTYLFIGRSRMEWAICNIIPLKYQNKSSQLHDSTTCWNNSFTFNARPYAFQDICRTGECFSQYRIGDGIPDCTDGEDEDPHLLAQTNYCQNIQKHRFQCAPDQMTCFSIMELVSSTGNSGSNCRNNYDQFIKGDGRALSNIKCWTDTKNSECYQLRYYIGNSSIRNSTFTDDLNENSDIKRSVSSIPFRFYCDSFWDEKSTHMDENAASCQAWICRENQFRCRTGQCIEVNWVCDGEWDCSDASDEFNLLQEWSDHNKPLLNLSERKEKCQEKYQNILPFFDFCNFDHEYPCFRASVSDPLNIYKYRPCINLTQIGDGIEDCYGGLDEKNTFEDCKGHMLGYTLRCGNTCVSYPEACLAISNCDATSYLCSYKSKNKSWCSGFEDVVCLNGTCVENARCDGRRQCSHGEDEHWCTPHSLLVHQISYRFSKYESRSDLSSIKGLLRFPKENVEDVVTKKTISLFQTFPSDLPIMNHVEKDQSRQWKILLSQNNTEEQRNSLPYRCNRGFPIFTVVNMDYQCICPPTYYGRWCEFFSDRLSIVTHVDLSSFPSLVSMNLLTVVVTLHFGDIIVDHHVFHVNPELETEDYIKQRFYLLYSRSNDFLAHKRWRFSNRTDIVNHHPYSVHFELYSLNENWTNELGSFRYPLYFDFLPVFRFASILRIPPWFDNSTLNVCDQKACHSKSMCKPIFNQNETFYCSCRSGYSGEYCEKYDSQCSSYCSSNSICRPKYRGLIGNPDHPLCICSLGYFGPRCNLRNLACKSSPCGLNSTCHPTYDPSGENLFVCLCSKQFYGDRCQYEKIAIRIEINMTASVEASVIQFYNIFTDSMALDLRHQQVVRGLPQMIRYDHGEQRAPTLAVLKTYRLTTSTKYFIVYVQPRTSIINITSTPEECPYALDLLPENKTSRIDAFFKYHHICRNNTNRICFYDAIYFCLCQPGHTGAHCFGHKTFIDHCESCLSGGKCIRGDLNHANDYICLCPSCHQGRFCEDSLEAFGFTLDSLLISESITVQFIYIGLSLILFCIGLFSNFCSFVTFKQKQTRKFGVGNYLFVVTIANQCDLLFLVIKFISVLLESLGQTNNTSCKIVSYLLSVFTRSTYWLTSWITIDRLFMVLYPTSTILKNPRIAIYSSIVTFFVLLAMHVHEIMFYQIIQYPESSAKICVTNFNYTLVATYNRVTTLFHYLLPFCIQIISITLLIVLAARSRAKASGNKMTFRQILKKQFSIQKELYVTPIIIIFSALPQAIMSFNLACTPLNNWKRHTLLVTSLLTYIPQGLGFVIYVLPSSAYTNEFKKTWIGKKYFKWIQWIHKLTIK